MLDVDAQGMQIDPGVLDRFGREVPPGLYGTKDFERLISLLTRTEAVVDRVHPLPQLMRRVPGQRQRTQVMLAQVW